MVINVICSSFCVTDDTWRVYPNLSSLSFTIIMFYLSLSIIDLWLFLCLEFKAWRESKENREQKNRQKWRNTCNAIKCLIWDQVCCCWRGGSLYSWLLLSSWWSSLSRCTFLSSNQVSSFLLLCCLVHANNAWVKWMFLIPLTGIRAENMMLLPSLSNLLCIPSSAIFFFFSSTLSCLWVMIHVVLLSWCMLCINE